MTLIFRTLTTAAACETKPWGTQKSCSCQYCPTFKQTASPSQSLEMTRGTWTHLHSDAALPSDSPCTRQAPETRQHHFTCSLSAHSDVFCCSVQISMRLNAMCSLAVSCFRLLRRGLLVHPGQYSHHIPRGLGVWGVEWWPPVAQLWRRPFPTYFTVSPSPRIILKVKPTVGSWLTSRDVELDPEVETRSCAVCEIWGVTFNPPIVEGGLR